MSALASTPACFPVSGLSADPCLQSDSTDEEVEWQPSVPRAGERAASQRPELEPEPTPPPATAVEDDGERVEVNLRGPGGIEMAARVRPTTVFQRIIDHFVASRKDVLPPGTTVEKISARFDGEKVGKQSTVQDVDLEDGDIVELIW